MEKIREMAVRYWQFNNASPLLSPGDQRVMNCLLIAFDEKWFAPLVEHHRSRTPAHYERFHIMLEAIREAEINERDPSDERIETLAVAVKESAVRWLKANVIH